MVRVKKYVPYKPPPETNFSFKANLNEEDADESMRSEENNVEESSSSSSSGDESDDSSDSDNESDDDSSSSSKKDQESIDSSDGEDSDETSTSEEGDTESEDESSSSGDEPSSSSSHDDCKQVARKNDPPKKAEKKKKRKGTTVENLSNRDHAKQNVSVKDEVPGKPTKTQQPPSLRRKLSATSKKTAKDKNSEKTKKLARTTTLSSLSEKTKGSKPSKKEKEEAKPKNRPTQVDSKSKGVQSILKSPSKKKKEPGVHSEKQDTAANVSSKKVPSSSQKSLVEPAKKKKRPSSKQTKHKRPNKKHALKPSDSPRKQRRGSKTSQISSKRTPKEVDVLRDAETSPLSLPSKTQLSDAQNTVDDTTSSPDPAKRDSDKRKEKIKKNAASPRRMKSLRSRSPSRETKLLQNEEDFSSIPNSISTDGEPKQEGSTNTFGDFVPITEMLSSDSSSSSIENIAEQAETYKDHVESIDTSGKEPDLNASRTSSLNASRDNLNVSLTDIFATVEPTRRAPARTYSEDHVNDPALTERMPEECKSADDDDSVRDDSVDDMVPMIPPRRLGSRKYSRRAFAQSQSQSQQTLSLSRSSLYTMESTRTLSQSNDDVPFVVQPSNYHSNDPTEFVKPPPMVRVKQQIRKNHKSWILLLVTICSIFILVLFVLLMLNLDEPTDEELYRDAEHLAELLDFKYNSIATGLAALAKTTQISQDDAWPYTSIANFERLASTVRKSVGADSLMLCPVVVDRDGWQFWASQAGNADWILEGRDFAEGKIADPSDDSSGHAVLNFDDEPAQGPVIPFSLHEDLSGQPLPRSTTPNQYVPVWQTSPVPDDLSVVNLDISQNPILRSLVQTTTQTAVVSQPIYNIEEMFGIEKSEAPHMVVMQPVQNEDTLKAFYVATVSWKEFLDQVDTSVTIQNNCGSDFLVEIVDGMCTFSNATSKRAEEVTMPLFRNNATSSNLCQYSLRMVAEEIEEFASNQLIVVILLVLVCVLFVLSVFNYFYDLHKSRQAPPQDPETVALQDQRAVEEKFRSLAPAAGTGMRAPNPNVKKLKDDNVADEPDSSDFPNTTVMYCDLEGFEFWSSTQEPAKVFDLLDKVYGQFESMVKRRRIFKVDTVGDCFVAVAGVPNPRKDHGVVMARFALDCRAKFMDLVPTLSKELGADCIKLRIGLHSGPVTAGILNEVEARRFQILGETFTFAQYMESTGVGNEIQVSQKTADLLRECDKDQWLVPRDIEISVEDGTTMQTYFLRENKKALKRSSWLTGKLSLIDD